MNTGRQKICPSCQGTFSCNAADISSCQCRAVVLDAAARAQLADRYTDCLCMGCLSQLQQAAMQSRNPENKKR